MLPDIKLVFIKWYTTKQVLRTKYFHDSETCDDGILNQDETLTDCGGLTCPACPSKV